MKNDMKNDMQNVPYDNHSYTGHLICWKSILAGFVLSLLIFTALTGLGVAFGGIGLADGTNGQNAMVFTGVWFILSAVLSLFASGYFTARMARRTNEVVAIGHGFVVAALFVFVLLSQGAMAVSWLTKTAASVVGGASATVSGAVTAASQNDSVREMAEDTFAGLDLKDAQTVIPGVVSRVVRGDTEGAKAYLARQSGKSVEEVNTQIATLQAKMNEAAVKAREATATAMKALGWSLFVLSVLGALAAGMGGLWAAMVNVRKPILRHQNEPSTIFTTTAKA